MDVANRVLPTDFMKQKTKKAPILWIARNCNASNGRQYYIEELMKYIKVDSYSSCLNTEDFPDKKSREQLMSEYKFYLAVENSNCEDYVTEKLADTLKYSAVPIIDGPASYDGYLPNKRAAIRMDAYPDPRDLAKYIKFLDENDDAYLAYFQYRVDALIKPPMERLDATFINLWSDQGAHNYRVSWCSLCRHLATTWKSRQNPIEYNTTNAIERKNRFIVDNTCMDTVKWKYATDGPPYDSYRWLPSKKDEFAYDVLKQIQHQRLNGNNSSFLSSLEDGAYNNILGMIVIINIIGLIIWLIYKRTNGYKRLPKQTIE
ncbi:hypothetical protein BJ944DRAFT_160744 [Cunninghamella echinulata]|nr:hypothetical protein BJ944DRAFT_160744 [Cunninghamella echinulata]